MLVAAGASLLLLDKGRSTARQLATQAGDSDLAIYLESKLKWKNCHSISFKDDLHKLTLLIWFLGQENFLKSNPNDPETNI